MAVTPSNFDAKCAELADWIVANAPFLYYDKATCTFRVDEQAREARQPVSAERQNARQDDITIPLPHWSGRFHIPD